LGGFLLFLIAGYVSVIDILSYFNESRPLFIFYSNMSADNDFGIILTFVLVILTVVGLASFIFQLHYAYKKLRKN
jgi:hypothetical protein